MTGRPATFVLVPGAWMGGWIWTDMVTRLRAAGHRAHTLTLTGLAAGSPPREVAAVRLERHVQNVLDLLDGQDLADVVLVGHSYSGIVVGQAADRVPQRVRRSVHLGSFLPRDGRSLIDDWGADPEARSAERRQIVDDGMLWAPPPADALAGVPDLDPANCSWLSARFVPHPGHTVLDPVRLGRPVTDQPGTYVSLAPTGVDALAYIPPELAGELPTRWRLRTLVSGHWPMASVPSALADVLIEEARREEQRAWPLRRLSGRAGHGVRLPHERQVRAHPLALLTSGLPRPAPDQLSRAASP
jgi:pimeloyl-ACP methyl ester carboxylesterase